MDDEEEAVDPELRREGTAGSTSLSSSSSTSAKRPPFMVLFDAVARETYELNEI